MPDEAPPARRPMIDPMPILGDVLNYLERLIFANARVTNALCDLVKKNNIESPEIDKAVADANAEFLEYLAFKAKFLPPGGSNG